MHTSNAKRSATISRLKFQASEITRAEIPSDLTPDEKVDITLNNPVAVHYLDYSDLSSSDMFVLLSLLPSAYSNLPLDKLSESHRQILVREHNDLSDVLAYQE